MVQSIKKQLLKWFDFIRFKRSYAQDGEDVVLASFYEGQKNYKGFYIDIGASHPVRFSNTLYFYKRGWKGINIDPTPGSMKAFNWLRPKDVNLEIGVGSDESVLTFYCFNQPELNTFDTELAQKRNTGKPYKIVKTVDVAIKPLASILDQHLSPNTKIDFMTIDVEGLDIQVLKSNNWEKYAPDYILAEDLGFTIDNLQASEVCSFLTTKNYKLVGVLKRTLIFKRLNI